MIYEETIELIKEEIQQEINKLPSNYKKLYPHISLWLVKKIINIYETHRNTPFHNG